MNVFWQILDIVLQIMEKSLIEETLQNTNKFWLKDTVPVSVESPTMLDMITTRQLNIHQLFPTHLSVISSQQHDAVLSTWLILSKHSISQADVQELATFNFTCGCA
jgi:hypothetical protein